jgi:choice-of-anchor A domain-containing protein
MASNTQSTGNIAVGGNVTLANYSAASAIAGMPGQAMNPANIVVGGQLTANNGGVGSNQAGTIYFANGAPTLNGFTARGGTVAKAPIDFNGAATFYQNLSKGLGALAANGTATFCNDGCLELKGTNPSLNVFSVQGAQLGGLNEINISAPQGSAVVINVTGSSATFQNGAVTETGVNNSQVMYNFPTATNITLVGSMNPMGTLLAPAATVTGGYGESTGQLIAGAYSGTTAFEDVAFSCTVTVPAAQ